MEIKTLFGLPAHPLIVHAAVVLLPLAAIATILAAAIPRARRHYAPIAFGLALAATIAVGLAQGSGEALEEKVDRTQLVRDHTGQAENVLPWAIGVTVVSGLVAGWPFIAKRRPTLPTKPITAALVVVSLVSGTGATWTVIEVGHSGAKATWSDVDETP